MGKKPSIALCILLIAILGGFGWLMLLPHEPTYKGRPVTDWIRDGYYNTNQTESDLNRQMKPKAIEAVIALGTNALPYYVDLMRTGEDSPLKYQFCNLLRSQHWIKFGFTETWPYNSHLRRWYGGCGLSILGPDAKAAIPALTQLLNEGDEDQMGRAAYALPAIGLEGIQPLANALANLNFKWRWTSVYALRFYATTDNYFAQRTPRTPEEIESAAKIIVPIMIPYLKDRDPQVRSAAIEVLGKFGREPAVVVPAIIENLKENGTPNAAFRDTYISTLGAFGPNAEAAVPDLLKFLTDPDPEIRLLATNALRSIDPEAAAKAGVK